MFTPEDNKLRDFWRFQVESHLEDVRNRQNLLAMISLIHLNNISEIFAGLLINYEISSTVAPRLFERERESEGGGKGEGCEVGRQRKGCIN